MNTCPQAVNHCALFWVWEWTRVRKQPIIALYFESDLELKFYNLEAYLLLNVLNIYRVDNLIDMSDIGINSKIPQWSSQWSSRGYIAAILEFKSQ